MQSDIARYFGVDDFSELTSEQLAELGLSLSAAQTRPIPSTPETGEIMDSWDEIIVAIDDGTAQERYAELMELMASEELYNDSAAFDQAMREYTALSKKIPVLEEEWLELTEKMEAGA